MVHFPYKFSFFPQNRADGSFFYTYRQMAFDLKKLKLRYGSWISVSSLGLTADFRKLYHILIGNPNASRHFLIQAAIHGREWLNTLLVMKQMEAFLYHISMPRKIFSVSFHPSPRECSFCFHLLPMVNPDGVTLAQSGLLGIRDQNLKRLLKICHWNDFVDGTAAPQPELYYPFWKANARGVDLNRNFHWGWDEAAGPSHPSKEGFKGESPGCERETAALLGLLSSWDFVCCLSYHSSGNLIYWDFEGNKASKKREEALARSLSQITGYELRSSVKEGLVRAGFSDYASGIRKIPSLTIETGRGECPLGMEKFIEIWEKNQDVWDSLLQI